MIWPNCRGNQASDEAWYTEIPVAAGTWKIRILRGTPFNLHFT